MPAPQKPWFAPKAHGYGAGLPVSWEGWAVLAVFFAGTLATALLLDGWLRAGAIGGLSVALVLIAYFKTDGGWRWRGMR